MHCAIELRVMHGIDGFADPYYEEVIAPDEASFFDLASSKLTVGWEEVYVDDRKDGEVATSVAGKS